MAEWSVLIPPDHLKRGGNLLTRSVRRSCIPRRYGALETIRATFPAAYDLAALLSSVSLAVKDAAVPKGMPAANSSSRDGASDLRQGTS